MPPTGGISGAPCPIPAPGRVPVPVSAAVAVGPAEDVLVCGESNAPASTPLRPFVGVDVDNPSRLVPGFVAGGGALPPEAAC